MGLRFISESLILPFGPLTGTSATSNIISLIIIIKLSTNFHSAPAPVPVQGLYLGEDGVGEVTVGAGRQVGPPVDVHWAVIHPDH